jgi:hypothetical protein
LKKVLKMTGELASDQARKRIAIFLDGTWNTTNDNTNVWRLRALTAPVGADQVRQSIYYNAGLGTQVGSKVRGGMFGVGIDDILLETYQWLVENYNDGDDIFIFGFSRGSYTARSLSGFVSRCGVLKPGGPLSIRQLYDRYRMGLKVASIERLLNHPPKTPTLEEEWLVLFSRFVNIKFLGVFDTVGSLGIPIGFSRFKTSHSFLNTGLRTSNIAQQHHVEGEHGLVVVGAGLFGEAAVQEGSRRRDVGNEILRRHQRQVLQIVADQGGIDLDRRIDEVDAGELAGAMGRDIIRDHPAGACPRGPHMRPL